MFFLKIINLYIISLVLAIPMLECMEGKKVYNTPGILCYLVFDEAPNDDATVLREIHWHFSNPQEESVRVTTAIGHEDEYFSDISRQKAILHALNFLYMQLPYNVLDLRNIEKVLLLNMSPVFSKISPTLYQRSINIASRCFTFDNGYKRKVVIPRTLESNYRDKSTGETQVRLQVISKFLPKLNPKDKKAYEERIVEFARMVLAPPKLSYESEEKHIHLDDLKNQLQSFAKHYKWGQKNKEKVDSVEQIEEMSDNELTNNSTKDNCTKEKVAILKEDSKGSAIKPTNRWFNFGTVVGGVSLGLNIGFAAKYLLKDYLDNNPKHTLSLLAMTSLLGGLGGCAVSKFLK